MKPKTKRLLTFLLMGGMAAIGVTFVLQAFRENLIFFYTPSEFVDQKKQSGKKVRLGGLVQEGSVRQTGNAICFQLTDLKQNLLVTYTGILPNLFREGQGIVVEGHWMKDHNLFQATVVFAKHDETYRPKGVEKLKGQGVWKAASQKNCHPFDSARVSEEKLLPQSVPYQGHPCLRGDDIGRGVAK